jgi:Transposase DDE domain
VRRGGGFTPKLTEPEVITIELCGESFQQPTDKAIFHYFRSHYQHFFPNLTDRTVFVRQAANLWRISELLQQRIVEGGGQRTANWQVIDTLPVPICRITRAKRNSFRGFDADYGYCAAKREYYYGFKLGLRISPLGMIVHYPLLQARSHDVLCLEDLVSDFRGDRIGDKGFLDQWRRPQLQNQGVFLRTPTRRNMKTSNGWNDTFAHCRKWVETVGSQLTQQFH